MCVPLTVVTLVALFAVQSRGTARVAAFFGPITLIWFVAIAIPGVRLIAADPSVLAALNPWHALTFVTGHGTIGLVALGAVFLAVTGAEALYADLGHFGRKPIQTAWIAIVLPALVLNYLGQGALVLANPKAIENPFFLLYPEWALLPMVLLATAATVIASQAVITGAYSLTRQAIQLGLLPRLEIRHTSEAHAGQIYMPRVNMMLLIGVLLLVALFRSSSALASAYGIAVTGTMVVTAMMAFVVIWKAWNWSPLAAAALIAPFLLIDLTFLGANMLKVHEGGWMPLALGGVIMVVMYTWRRGSRLLFDKTRKLETPLNALVATLQRKPPLQVPGTAVFLTSDPASAPTSLLHSLKHYKVLHRHNVVLTVETADTPRVAGRRTRAHRTHRRELFLRYAPFRLHGNAECTEGARDRAQARLAIRHHVDVVLPVAAFAQARGELRHAALAGPAVHRARARPPTTRRITFRFRPAGSLRSAPRLRYDRCACADGATLRIGGARYNGSAQRGSTPWPLAAKTCTTFIPRTSRKASRREKYCWSTSASRTKPRSSAIRKPSICRCRNSIRRRCPLRPASRSCSRAAPATAR